MTTRRIGASKKKQWHCFGQLHLGGKSRICRVCLTEFASARIKLICFEQGVMMSESSGQKKWFGTDP